MQESEESQEENQCTWKDGVEDAQNHDPQVKELHADAAELWDAEPHKHVVGIEQTS